MKLRCICLCVLLVVASFPLFAQNYILTRTFKNGVATEANDVSKTTTQVQYVDGLGRPIQTVSIGQSPTGKDFITHQQYDQYGREVKQYLPFSAVGTTGSLRTNAASLQNDFYTNNVPSLVPTDLGRPFQEASFEASPLSRVVGQQAPGNQSNSSTIVYSVNSGTSGEWAVKRYDFQENSTLTQTVVAQGYYGDEQLSMTKTTDEAGKVMLVAKDKAGQVVLKRALVSGANYADTYYVYDDLGRLRAVLQPLYQTNADASKYAFLYRYDAKGRLTEKRVPGAESVEMRYDQYDRLVVSRDGNQKVRNVWSFTKYDALNRPIMTGEVGDSEAFSESALMSNGHHETFNGNGDVKYSLTATLPTNILEGNVLTVSYYDTYNNWGALAYVDTYGIANETNLKGYPTGGRTRILNPDGTYGNFLIHTLYYDSNYRPIQTVKQLFGFAGNENKLWTSTKYKYDVATVVEREQEEQITNVAVLKIEKVYSYDHADRLLSISHQIWRDNVAKPQVTLSALDYNELGQLSAKWLHSTDGTNFRRKIAYTYNIRGWQTEGKAYHKKEGISAEQTQFSYQLAYVDGANKYSNGNINALNWTHAAAGTLPAVTGAYSFGYDGLNRLLSTGTAGGTNEGDIQYDLNGNIEKLKRWKGGTLIDNLTYEYANGNRLGKIDDASGNAEGFKDEAGADYEYDPNGNLLKDNNKGIATNGLQYNLLNRVRKITLGGKSLEYHYDASGQKHQLMYSNPTEVSKSETSRYAGSAEYQGFLKRIATGEGQYIFQSPTVGEYQYYLTDHLGNTRVVVSGQGEVLQRNDYYAFGLAIDAVDRGENKYLFLNRELQPETGYYDLIHRQYDPAKARFDAVDPKPDDGDQESLSTYQYGLNNPVLRSDPNGDCSKCWDAIKSWLTAPISTDAQNIGRAYMISSIGMDSKPQNRWQFIAAVMGQAGQHFGGSTPGNLKIRIPNSNSLKINTSRKSIPQKGDFVFRGDERRPDVIFNEGFKSKGDNTNLEQHVKYNPDDDAYIGTTKSPKVAASGDYGEYVYTIKDTKTGKDVNQEMGPGRFSYEQEIAIPYLIPSQNIMGVRKVDNAGKFSGPFIKNPNYQQKSQ